MAIACCLIAVACVGCGKGGPALGTVSGTVTMDGKPLENALVTFTPAAGGRGSTGTTDASGKYELAFIDGKGALVGGHKVTVTSLPKAVAAVEVSSDSPEYANQGSSADYDSAAVNETIPAKYNTQSTLTFEVKPGPNTYDIPIESAE
ncbi:MAG: carboxypeptidase-like regulatory domain-containing protein [Thermoguttaceae bacterium]